MAKRKKNQKTATGRSPYKKYNKRETQYSPEYRAWNAAAKKGQDKGLIAATHADWVAEWGVSAQNRRYERIAA